MVLFTELNIFFPGLHNSLLESTSTNEKSLKLFSLYSHTQQTVQKWCFCTTGHRLGTSGAPAIFAAPVTEACKIHTSSALSPARLIFSPSLACPKLESSKFSLKPKQKAAKNSVSLILTVFDFSILFPHLHFTLILNSFTLSHFKIFIKAHHADSKVWIFSQKKKMKNSQFWHTPISYFHFFSLGFFLFSQIDYLIRTTGGISKYLLDCKFMSLPEPGSDDGLMTPDSILEPAGSSRTSSGSGGYGGGTMDCRTLTCTATTEIVRKKRSSLSACRPVCSSVSEISAMNRRKGTPQRAPLYWNELNLLYGLAMSTGLMRKRERKGRPGIF